MFSFLTHNSVLSLKKRATIFVLCVSQTTQLTFISVTVLLYFVILLIRYLLLISLLYVKPAEGYPITVPQEACKHINHRLDNILSFYRKIKHNCYPQTFCKVQIKPINILKIQRKFNFKGINSWF